MEEEVVYISATMIVLITHTKQIAFTQIYRYHVT